MAALKAKYRQLTELMFLVSRPNYRDDIFTFINYLKTTKPGRHKFDQISKCFISKAKKCTGKKFS